MKKVLLRYPVENIIKIKKFKIPLEASGLELRGYIARDLPQFASTDYFLAQEYLTGRLNMLEENSPLIPIPGEKKIILQLTYKHYPVLVNFVDGRKQTYNFDLSETVRTNLHLIVPGVEEHYVFVFSLKSDPSYLHTTTLSLPLYNQRWSYEPLTILRRVIPSDTEGLSDPMKIKMMASYCKYALKAQLSLYDAPNLIRLRVLQHILDGRNINQWGKAQYMQTLPEAYRSNEENIILFQEAIKEYSNITPPTAAREYVEISATKGAQCAFIDRVKFLIVGSKWKVSTHRYLYLSPRYIYVTKEIGSQIIYSAPTTNIAKIEFKDQFVFITLKNKEQWRIKSDRPQILYAAANDFHAISYNEENLKNDDIDEEYDEGHSDNLLADSTRLTDTEDSGFQFYKPLSRAQTPNFISINDVVKAQPGISELIIPGPNEENGPYSMEPLLYRDLKILEPLVIPPFSKKDKKYNIPDISFYTNTSRFFSLSQKHTRIIICLFVLVLIYYSI